MSNKEISRLQVGIIGAGLMGRWHAKTASRLGAQLTSILDHDPSQAEKLQAELGCSSRLFTDIDDMLSSTQLDIVHICTPLINHYPTALQLINAGIHVIVEKPMAASVVETESLLQASRQQDVRLCPVHQFGFQDGVIDAIEKLDSLGELLSVSFTTNSAGGETHSESRLNEIIADIIPHPLSVLQRLRPGIKLDTTQWQGLHTRDGELRLIGAENGISIGIHISMNARPTRCEMNLYCSNGRLYLNFFHGYSIIEKGNVSRIQKIAQPFKYALKEFMVAGGNIIKRSLRKELAYPGLVCLLDRFYHTVVTGAEAPISPEDILAVARTRDSLITRFLPDIR